MFLSGHIPKFLLAKSLIVIAGLRLVFRGLSKDVKKFSDFTITKAAVAGRREDSRSMKALLGEKLERLLLNINAN